MIAFYWFTSDLSKAIRAPRESVLSEDGRRLRIPVGRGRFICTRLFVAYEQEGELWKYLAGRRIRQGIKTLGSEGLPLFVIDDRGKIVRTIDGQEVLA